MILMIDIPHSLYGRDLDGKDRVRILRDLHSCLSSNNVKYAEKDIDYYFKHFSRYKKDLLICLFGYNFGRKYIENNLDKFKRLNIEKAAINSVRNRSKVYMEYGLGADTYMPGRTIKQNSVDEYVYSSHEAVTHNLGIIGDEIELNIPTFKKSKEFLINWLRALPDKPNRNSYINYFNLIYNNVHGVFNLDELKKHLNGKDEYFIEYVISKFECVEKFGPDVLPVIARYEGIGKY